MIAIFLALSTLTTTGLAEQLRNSRSAKLSTHLALRSKKVVVEIYYETLCPSSVEFLDGSFRKAWQAEELRELMDVRLYPFGNAQMLSEKEVNKQFKDAHPEEKYPVVECQHGPEECLGNKIQACAIEKLEMSQSVDLILCMASQGPRAAIDTSTADCAKKLDISMHGVMDCASSTQGHDIMMDLAKKSLDPKLQRSYVPFVMVSGKHEQAADEGDLLTPLCEALGTPKPAVCEGSASAGVADTGQISLAHHITNSSFCYRSTIQPVTSV